MDDWHALKVLDLAAGSGVVAETLAPRVGAAGRLLCTDISHEMLDLEAARAFGLVVAATRNDRLGISLLVLELMVVLGVRGLVALQARSVPEVSSPRATPNRAIFRWAIANSWESPAPW